MKVAIRFMMFPERKSLRRSYTKLRPGPSYESLQNITPVTLKNWLIVALLRLAEVSLLPVATLSELP